MKQKFRLFIQKHENGAYTVTVPGFSSIYVEDNDDGPVPAAPSLAAHGYMVEEAKDDIRTASRSSCRE